MILIRIIIYSLLIIGCTGISVAANPPMAGGYSYISTADPNVQLAAYFAAQQINKGDLIKIITAQSQVVAGINYKIQLQLADPQGKQYIYDVIVFVPLPVTNSSMQLTNAVLQN